ncbi:MULTISPECIES: alcohol dehydrogenase catalytic domain-containing protein [unclassified Enterococcus]|uniref:zinc-dependent alcohol dehydrogenase n=1 Tax=unclassified Enterococcus TaxID=2608891 RepID=UPI001557841A|nr:MULTISPECIES: alcohol dehydrogenase catalytic domain-containing protein [unclassified Enterococcus]MBS7577901.1 alcohol dehydrogenase catalytic domain-containing protein [Enterococcus sp. MMGLQ5-2]MBS7585238.1 alcohol dehydrogenase catalytic domain-containing protein [Enterococcus sp. MMGLQ5-1]NPD13095.1 alcohol dehydrogenase catalytic domain-containing protein [Enterococcus sp. MMGLQ5-1]NPD37731.1 alcohol dehydrogenase catalytic domain-containing protein [Enterococcus sp. MMGLQ5-2]
MKSALFIEPNNVQFTQQEMPVLESNEALIKVKYAGICGSDIHVYQGHHATATYPRIPGHEFVGELIDFQGKMKNGIEIGDAVVAQPFFSCGNCPSCITGYDNVCEELKILGIHVEGTFAEYVKVPIKKLYKVRKDMDMRLAAMAEPLAVAVHDVMTAKLEIGDKVLVSGGGPIGMLIAVVAKHAGAEVTISEVSDYRLNYAKNMGFNIVNPIKDSLKEYAKTINDGTGFDTVFETSGVASSILASTAAVKIRGKVIIIGIAKENCPFSTNDVYSKELQILGVRVHSQYAFARAVSLLDAGVLDEDLYQILDDKIYPLEEVEAALKYCIEDINHFKTLISINS